MNVEGDGLDVTCAAHGCRALLRGLGVGERTIGKNGCLKGEGCACGGTGLRGRGEGGRRWYA